jgi:hypothetical protein
MDVGDGFYGEGLGASIILVTGAELTALFIVACGFLARRRARVYFAFIAVLFVVAAQCAIASGSAGSWRKLFLGCDPAEDLAWLASGFNHTNDPPIGWLAFNALCHLVLLTLTVLGWRSARPEARAHIG